VSRGGGTNPILGIYQLLYFYLFSPGSIQITNFLAYAVRTSNGDKLMFNFVNRERIRLIAAGDEFMALSGFAAGLLESVAVSIRWFPLGTPKI